MRLLFLFLCLCCVVSAVAQMTAMGVEANGPDQATQMAYQWRKPNVFDQYFPQAGFKVLLISQSTRQQVYQTLTQNPGITHITGCGHGSASQYTGYQMSTIFSTSDTQLLQLLRGKHVHLLSCQTAQMLGGAIVRNGALSYCGYYPNFSFTYKSFADFMEADAALDKQFCGGKSSKQAYAETIRKFNEKIDLLSSKEPDAVRIMVEDRDGLRCMDQQGLATEICTCASMPQNMAQYALFAKNLLNGKFITFAEYQQNNERTVNFRDMDATTFQELVLASYERVPQDFTVGVMSVGMLTRDEIITEIQNHTELGNYFVETERAFLTAIGRPMWEHFINVTTDQNGNFSIGGNFDAPTGLVKGVTLRWHEGVETFSKATFQFNETPYALDKPLKYEEYSIFAKVSNKSNSYKISAEGGPANTQIEVVLADCGCGK